MPERSRTVKRSVRDTYRPEESGRRTDRRSNHTSGTSERSTSKRRKWLGAGGFADVYSETDSSTKQTTAVKVFKPICEIDAGASISEGELRGRISQEIQILKSLSRSRHAASYIDDKKRDGKVELYMVYYRSNLHDMIEAYRKSGEGWCPPFFGTAMKQLTQGVAYIHSKGVIHSDLKPENVLCDDVTDLKIADFGCATYVGKYDRKGGTKRFAAPEMYVRDVQLTIKFDIWSLGIIALEMFGAMPGDRAEGEGLTQYCDRIRLRAEKMSKVRSVTFPVLDALEYAADDRSSAPTILSRLGSSSGMAAHERQLPSQTSHAARIDSSAIPEIRPRWATSRTQQMSHQSHRPTRNRRRDSDSESESDDHWLQPPSHQIQVSPAPSYKMISPGRYDSSSDEDRHPPSRPMHSSIKVRNKAMTVGHRDRSDYDHALRPQHRTHVSPTSEVNYEIGVPARYRRRGGETRYR